jgi:hypothetical protein
MKLVPGMQLSLEDLPSVDRALNCSLPVYMFSPDYPEYPGNSGTCFAVRYGGRVVLVTARHVIQGNPPHCIAAPLGFDREVSFKRRHGLFIPSQILYPAPADADDSDLDRFDLAVLLPATEPEFGPEVVALEIETIARMSKVPKKCLFAVAGYPRTDVAMSVDYENRQLQRNRYATPGTYIGPLSSSQGCHTIEVDCSDIGGADGLSGSPVLRMAFDAHHNVSHGLAGIVIRGGDTRLHFIDVKYVLSALREVLGPPGASAESRAASALRAYESAAPRACRPQNQAQHRATKTKRRAQRLARRKNRH